MPGLLEQAAGASTRRDARPFEARQSVARSRPNIRSSAAVGKVVDACLQLFGGYGYMNEYPICRIFADQRVGRIYGGSNEVMKELIARAMER